MRVLLVNYCVVGESDATSQTLKNIFSGMKDVEILQYTLNPCASESIQNLEGTQIRTVRNIISNPFVRFVYKHSATQKTLEPSALNKKTPKNRIIKNILKRYLLLLNELIPNMADEHVASEIDKFQPDVIYTLAADINVLKSALWFSDRYCIPIVIHNMDDLYSTKFSAKTPLNFICKIYLRKLYRQAYSKSKKSLAIGPLMAEEYSEKFNLPFDWAMNCVPATFENIKHESEEKLMIFSGGLHGGRSDTLLCLAKELEKLNSGYRLEIFTSNKDFKSFHSSFIGLTNTSVFEYVPKHQQFENLARARVLVHVESFKKKYIKYFRLSMSTKIAEYMSLGKRILCVGDDSIATVKFIKDNNVGVTISDVSKLGDALKSFDDDSIVETMRQNSLTLSKTIFSKEKVQERVYKTLQCKF